MYKIEKEFAGQKLILETGKVAKSASGGVWIQYGENIVLVTAVISPAVREEMGFIPLTVDYREKAYAAGKIPGGFLKREGKPSDEEILSSRLIDRSVRPLFPEGFRNETQIIATVLSASEANQPPILGITGASLGLAIANRSVTKLVAGVRVGRVDGQFIINPTDNQLEESELDIVVAGNKDGITMVEGQARRVPDLIVLEALKEAHSAIKTLVKLGDEFISSIPSRQVPVSLCEIEQDLKEKAVQFLVPKIEQIGPEWDYEAKEEYLEEVKEKLLEKFLPEYPEKESDLVDILGELKKKKLRELVTLHGKRWDGREPEDIRMVTCEVGVLPRVHGSAIFTRGGTQSLVVATLGTSSDEQIIDGLQREETTKRFMFHYNFPPFSTGEARRLGAPGRREIGHGFLSERALLGVLPDEKSFPYTIRLVSDILESNGSSSMASVCGGSLCLMDAGVPIPEAVAGVAMGLIEEDEKKVLLTDIQGIEDHLGDMDFKVAGTKEGVTALQMDIKIERVGFDTLEEAFQKAKKARGFILEKMNQIISEPRARISEHAPRITILSVPKDKIGEIIGPGGKVVKKIIQETGAKIEIDDTEGQATIAALNDEATEKAARMIRGIIGVQPGEVYTGKVKRITDFGAFVEIFPGKEGLVHISELSDKYVKKVTDVIKPGDEILVKVIDIDRMGRINLSKKRVTGEEEKESK